jgi:4-alpha-glucanotransferase
LANNLALLRLARLYGLQTSFIDASGDRVHASPESLQAVLQIFGVHAASAQQVASAAMERSLTVQETALASVSVIWAGMPGYVEIKIPTSEARTSLAADVELEDGTVHKLQWDLALYEPQAVVELDNHAFASYQLPITQDLPLGYHQLTMDWAGRTWQSLVIVAPQRCHPGPGGRSWGVFMPLYALRSEADWGTGSYRDLKNLSAWSTELGGSLVGTLPLLPSFSDEPYEPSPYAPVSRIAWNPLFIDVAQASGLSDCPEALDMLQSEAVAAHAKNLRELALVDYRQAMHLKRKVLACLSACEANRERVERLVQSNPVLDEYAKFMAVVDRRKEGWNRWPERLRTGPLHRAEYNQRDWQYHAYAQMAAEEQLAGHNGTGLYLDFPIGVHAEGFDVWSNQQSFLLNASVGAPPDPFFTKGQDWGFPPLHPDRQQEAGYSYLIACLRHHLGHASLLRIDHVMGLHRQYWIPKGMDATQGVYVRYPAEEIYAILSLESHRHQSGIAGEDLGTVPTEVRRSMARHGLKRLYVAQFEANAESIPPLHRPPQGAVASLNTHDMATFAAYADGADIEDRRAMGLLDAKASAVEVRARNRTVKAVAGLLQKRDRLAADEPGHGPLRDALLKELAASKAGVVLVNLEDLWLEPEPQNVPGTNHERPNWQRKARFTMEEFSVMGPVMETLKDVNRMRRQEVKQ